MNRINSLSDLLMEELGDLLDAEKQLTEALPKIIQASQFPALITLLQNHLAATREQAGRLQDIFSNIGHDTQGIFCKTMKGLIAELEHSISHIEKGKERDKAIIQVVQRIEHYEITGYGIAYEHADELGHTGIVELLDKTINEERNMHLNLSELAQGLINVEATETPSKQGGFYVPEGKFNRKGVKKKKNTDISRYIDEGNPNVQE